jgi:Tubulin-specific chaperone C N-terminal domain
LVVQCSEPATEVHARALIKTHADTIVHSIFELDRSTSTAAYFLPAFEVRKLTGTVQGLRAALQSVRESKLPRIPFAFTDPDSIVIVEDPLQQVRSRLRKKAESLSRHCKMHGQLVLPAYSVCCFD